MPQKEGYRISSGRPAFERYWQNARLFYNVQRWLPYEKQRQEMKHIAWRAWVNGRIHERKLQHLEAEKRRADSLSGRVRRFWSRGLALLSTKLSQS